MSLNINKLPLVSLKVCEYNKKNKSLRLASEFCGMPDEFEVVSHHTGEIIKFRANGVGDPNACDKVAQMTSRVYRPTTEVKNVDYAVIYDQY